MLRVLLPHFRRVIATEFQENPRAVPVEQIAQWCREEFVRVGRPDGDDSLQSYKLPTDAWAAARKFAAPDELICIAGSFFIAAELRSLAAAGAAHGVPA